MALKGKAMSGPFSSFPDLNKASNIGHRLLTSCSSDLTFALEPGWAFVVTEDWRKDLVASWAEGVESDEG